MASPVPPELPALPASPEPPAPAPAGLAAAQRAAFEQLRARFVAGLPERWQRISKPDAPGQRAQALHQLAGAAGSYGFPAIGELARQAERQAVAVEAGSADPRALVATLAELEAALAAVLPPGQVLQGVTIS